MNDHSNNEIAAAWLKNCRAAIAKGSDSEEADDSFWAYMALDDLCSTDPMRALEIISQILATQPEERVRYNLSAGPLEDLLKRRGLVIATEIERLASNSPAFQDLLGGVWTDDMDDETRELMRRLVRGDGRSGLH